MDKSKTAMRDPLLDEVRETRTRLVREHSGLRGWVAYLQEQQREHPKKRHPRGKSPDR